MSERTARKVFDDLRSSDEFHIEAAKLEFALELKRVMDREEVSKAELASRLNVSAPMVSKLLRGDANLTIETMVKVARRLSGQLFLKIARDGCSARMFELAKTSRAAEIKSRATRSALSQVHGHDAWHLAANDFELMEGADEIQPLAA